MPKRKKGVVFPEKDMIIFISISGETTPFLRLVNLGLEIIIIILFCGRSMHIFTGKIKLHLVYLTYSPNRQVLHNDIDGFDIIFHQTISTYKLPQLYYALIYIQCGRKANKNGVQVKNRPIRRVELIKLLILRTYTIFLSGFPPHWIC